MIDLLSQRLERRDTCHCNNFILDCDFFSKIFKFELGTMKASAAKTNACNGVLKWWAILAHIICNWSFSSFCFYSTFQLQTMLLVCHSFQFQKVSFTSYLWLVCWNIYLASAYERFIDIFANLVLKLLFATTAVWLKSRSSYYIDSIFC